MWKILCKNILYIDIAIFALGYFILPFRRRFYGLLFWKSVAATIMKLSDSPGGSTLQWGAMRGTTAILVLKIYDKVCS